MLPSSSHSEFVASMTLFRSLKGAPASVLCVLGFTRVPMTNQELQHWTGYAHERITTALRLLTDLGWVTAVSPRGPWLLAERGATSLMQLPPAAGSAGNAGPATGASSTPGMEDSIDPEASASDVVRDSPASHPETAMMLIQSLKGAPASVLLALSATRRAMTRHDLELWTRCGAHQVTLGIRALTQLGWVRARSSRGPWFLAERAGWRALMCLKEAMVLKPLNDDDGSLTLETEGASTSRVSSSPLLVAMHESGIEEPTASELASLPHVTVEYVRAHVEAARAKGMGVGAAIARMRLASPIPVAAAKGRSRSEETAEKIRRFIEGE